MVRREKTLLVSAPAIAALLQQAIVDHQAGRLAQAEVLYREILQREPACADALHLLGVIALQARRLDTAVELIGGAIALVPDEPAMHGNLGEALRQLGRLAEAEASFCRALARQPNFADALQGLGTCLAMQGRRTEAIDRYQAALALRPTSPDVWHNLGILLRDADRAEDALHAFQQALALRPDFAEACSSLGSLLRKLGRLDDAHTALERLVALRPQSAEAWSRLGAVRRAQGNFAAATVALDQAIALDPTHAPSHLQRGNVHYEQRQYEPAIGHYRQAVALKPDYAEAHYQLGTALQATRRTDAAVLAFGRTIDLSPDFTEAHFNLGTLHKDRAELDLAIRCYRRAHELRPENPAAHSNLIYTLLFRPETEPATLRAEYRQWCDRYAAPELARGMHHGNSRDPDRRLRIGYVSPDFRDHVVGHNVLPLFRESDREHFELFCYADLAKRDAATAEFARRAHTFRDVTGQSHAAVADRVRADGIDVLVDLTLHMAETRLPVFARRPAPVQVTFAGYPGTTGLAAIDYRLTDPHLDPPDAETEWYAETSLRLPDTFWCYTPLEGAPDPGPLPALATGRVTFGCLNNFCKVNGSTLDRWARVLGAIPRARLLLLAPAGNAREWVAARLEAQGVARDRVEFVPFLPRSDYLATHRRIDIGLDTLPYNGHTTSLDACWMGVPVVTQVGTTVAGRAGWSQLNNLGLPELAASTPDEFVALATRLASDLPRLTVLRAELRGRMQRSPLMDAARFTRGVEAAFREMWRRWCAPR